MGQVETKRKKTEVLNSNDERKDRCDRRSVEFVGFDAVLDSKSQEAVLDSKSQEAVLDSETQETEISPELVPQKEKVEKCSNCDSKFQEPKILNNEEEQRDSCDLHPVELVGFDSTFDPDLREDDLHTGKVEDMDVLQKCKNECDKRLGEEELIDDRADL